MVEFRNVANFDAVWLPRWRRGEVRAYRAKKSKKKVCSDYLFENSCNVAERLTSFTFCNKFAMGPSAFPQKRRWLHATE